ncbi:hypothetical protein BJX66DRAFT_338214 [Aspergillus keveii]|uniref:Uncharacterized protein n=1 Tax=Aspergillus keveii TaxID=714993 RepID=A0ABR4G4W6_9EURO
MAVSDKDRPRGLRVPSLSTFRSKNKQSDPTPTIQLPSPSQLSLHTDSLSIPSSSPLQKALPPQPLPSPPQPYSPAVTKPYPSPPQASHSQPSPIPSPSSAQYNRNDAPPPPHHAMPPSIRPMARPIPPPNSQPTRRPVPGSAPVTATAPGPQYAPAPIPAQAANPVNLMVPQQRTPPSSEGGYEQRLSNGTSDSLEDFIPDPEPEPELDGTSGTPNEAGSSEEDDNRPWTPPEVEPVPVPLNKLHYSCYQEHRAMPAAANVWYALPCMTCQKFDREIRHRCVFCCLRVCADCFTALKKIPQRSLAELMQTIEVNGNGAAVPPSVTET